MLPGPLLILEHRVWAPELVCEVQVMGEEQKGPGGVWVRSVVGHVLLPQQ